MNSAIAIAAKGKGVLNTARRAAVIMSRYGITARKVDGILAYFARILDEYECSATFPLVAAALVRNRGIVEKYQGKNIEYAVHGYYHVDHKQLTFERQAELFHKARQEFESRGVNASGFRAPYLRSGTETLKAIKEAGLIYDSSQVIAWNVTGGNESAAYRRVLGFYGAISATEFLALPRLDDGLIRIPYCVPDDEALIDRLQFDSAEAMNNPWLAILKATHQRGELFTLGLHPERVHLCESALRETLRAARQLQPAVWFARLDTISHWWLARSSTRVNVHAESDGLYRIDSAGPEGTTLLARHLEVIGDSKFWDGVYRQIDGSQVTVRSNARPVIAVSERTDPNLSAFLRQQGFIVETAVEGSPYSLWIDRPRFDHADEKPLLEEVEANGTPLVRLGRWPYGARSALCITGDIDALTIWDYYLRFIGK